MIRPRDRNGGERREPYGRLLLLHVYIYVYFYMSTNLGVIQKNFTSVSLSFRQAVLRADTTQGLRRHARRTDVNQVRSGGRPERGRGLRVEVQFNHDDDDGQKEEEGQYRRFLGRIHTKGLFRMTKT